MARSGCTSSISAAACWPKTVRLWASRLPAKTRSSIPAEAEIEGDAVVVWSDEVAKPVAVRYAWLPFPEGNLWNKDGLPASPFRTDDFPFTTQNNK